MSEYYLGTLVSESSFLTNPQDSLKNVTEDNTSIFGNFDSSFLAGINVMHSTENINTPFSYDNVINNVFADNNIENQDIYDGYYDDEDQLPSFGFEC